MRDREKVKTENHLVCIELVASICHVCCRWDGGAAAGGGGRPGRAPLQVSSPLHHSSLQLYNTGVKQPPRLLLTLRASLQAEDNIEFLDEMLSCTNSE